MGWAGLCDWAWLRGRVWGAGCGGARRVGVLADPRVTVLITNRPADAAAMRAGRG